MSRETVQNAPRRKQDAGFRVIDGQGVVVVPGRSEVHLINQVATRVWELIDGRRDAAAIAAEIEKEFEVSPETARADVEEFLGVLADKGMLE